MKYDLAVCVRICRSFSGGHEVFHGDKALLTKVCAKSLASSFGNLKVKVWALLDRVPDYEGFIRESFNLPNIDLEIVHTKAEDLGEMNGNHYSFLKQCDILFNQTDSDIIYFVEDDYFHLPNGVEEIVRFMQENPQVEITTGFIHRDYGVYSEGHPYHKFPVERYEELTFENRDYCTCLSTTCTQFVNLNSARSSERFFREYPRIGDFGMYLALTNLCKADIISNARDMRVEEDKEFNLWRPKTKGIATHCAHQTWDQDHPWAELMQKGINEVV